MNLLRTFAGRLSAGAWRSRKYVLWTVCLMALTFLVYVQYTPNSMNGIVNEPQQHRSLHSYRRYQSQESRKNPQRVRFVDNDYIKNEGGQEEEDNNERERNVEKGGEKLEANVVNNREETLQRRHESAVKWLEERRLNEEQIQQQQQQQQQPIVDRLEPPRIVEESGFKKVVEPIPLDNQRRDDNYVGNAAAAWNGGSFRYNPYGEPVYNHDNRPNYVPKERMVHFDLKGAPPLPSVYKTLIPWLAKYGATSILMEYEDMFPWEGPLSSFSAKNHYSKEDIKEILAICKENNIKVIPLVQTFGHLEYALKLPKYSYLREVPELPQALCPSHNDSHWLVKTMIDQMMALHSNVKYLHIGCDEVFQMGECERCRMKSRDNLFLEHVSRTAKYARTTYGVIPIIWHDMLTHVSESAMKAYNFGELVEPMVWVYAEDVYRFVQPSMWTRFSQVFSSVWGASAFKGAFGEQSTVPNVRRHLDNNLNWLDVMSSESPKFSGGFRGLVITGWQRHDHFAVLCELFPAALPSLTVNLIATSRGFFNATVYPKLYEALNCMQTPNYQSEMNLDTDPFLWDKFSWCYFPGALVFKSTARLDAARRDVRSYIDRVTLKRAWVSDYNRRHNFSSPMRIDEDLEELPSRLHTLTLLLRTVKEALLEWFDEWTTGEWIEQHIWPLLNELETLQKESESMKLVKTWPARPLPLLPQLETFGIKEPKKVKVTARNKEDPQSIQRYPAYDGRKRLKYI